MAQIILAEGAAPSTPAANTSTMYVKSDGLVYSKDDGGIEYCLSKNLTSGTLTATTSGTSVDFTSIPTGTKRLIIMLNGVSSSGTSNVILQIGPSGGVETSGYSGDIALANAAAIANTNLSSGVTLNTSTAAASVIQGQIIFSLIDPATNTWVFSGMVAGSNNNYIGMVAGSKALAGALSRARLTTAGGTDTFDAGSMNILYE